MMLFRDVPVGDVLHKIVAIFTQVCMQIWLNLAVILLVYLYIILVYLSVLLMNLHVDVQYTHNSL